SNALVAGDDPVELLRAVADRVVSMHASDRYLAEGATLADLRQADGSLGYSANLRHGVTGRGLNDYEAIFRILAEHGYQGWVGICDASAERAQAFAVQHQARPFTEVAALLSESRPEAVLICTPHPLHAGPAVQAAQAGAHVLVEKPMAASLEDCDAMLEAARK